MCIFIKEWSKVFYCFEQDNGLAGISSLDLVAEGMMFDVQNIIVFCRLVYNSSL